MKIKRLFALICAFAVLFSCSSMPTVSAAIGNSSSGRTITYEGSYKKTASVLAKLTNTKKEAKIQIKLITASTVDIKFTNNSGSKVIWSQNSAMDKKNYLRTFTLGKDNKEYRIWLRAHSSNGFGTATISNAGNCTLSS